MFLVATPKKGHEDKTWKGDEESKNVAGGKGQIGSRGREREELEQETIALKNIQISTLHLIIITGTVTMTRHTFVVKVKQM